MSKKKTKQEPAATAEDRSTTAGPTPGGPPEGAGGMPTAPPVRARFTGNYSWGLDRMTLRFKAGDVVTEDDIPDLAERLKAGKEPLEAYDGPDHEPEGDEDEDGVDD